MENKNPFSEAIRDLRTKATAPLDVSDTTLLLRGDQLDNKKVCKPYKAADARHVDFHKFRKRKCA